MTTKPATKSSTDPATDVLKRAATSLMSFSTHLNFLKTFDEERDRATAGQPAYILNSLVWDTVLCSRQVFVIRFASWAKRTYRNPKGLFEVLRQNSKKLYVKKPKPPYVPEEREHDQTEDEYVAEIKEHNEYEQAKARYDKFVELFPNAAKRKDGKVDIAEIDVLKDKLVAIAAPVIKDRNANRAHPYREDRQKRKEVPELALHELEAALQQCKELVSGLSLVVRNEPLSREVFIGGDPQQTSQKLVDLILFDQDPGDILYGAGLHMFELSHLNEPKRREEAYRRLHEHFAETRTDDPWKPKPHHWFNDIQELHKLKDHND